MKIGYGFHMGNTRPDFAEPQPDCPATPSCTAKHTEWIKRWSKSGVWSDRPDACPACEEAELAARFAAATKGAA